MFDERKYRLNAKLSSFKKKVEKSKKIIEEMMDKCKKPYIAWSSGKDSTAMTYLILEEMGYKLKLFSEKEDITFPDEIKYIKMMVKKYRWDVDIISPDISTWDLLLLPQNKDIFNKKHHTKLIDKNGNKRNLFDECIKKFKEYYKPDGVFLGIRADESKARRIHIRKKGYTYHTKYDDLYHCNPIAFWNSKDVFSYLISRSIPILPLYYKTTTEQVERLRNGNWIPFGLSIQFGDVLFLRKEYPELHQKLKKHFPEVASAC